jgi:hypothetical protein
MTESAFSLIATAIFFDSYSTFFLTKTDDDQCFKKKSMIKGTQYWCLSTNFEENIPFPFSYPIFGPCNR